MDKNASRECRFNGPPILVGVAVIISVFFVIVVYNRLIDWIATRSSAQVLCLLAFIDFAIAPVLEFDSEGKAWRKRHPESKLNNILHMVGGIGIIVIFIGGLVFLQLAAIPLIVIFGAAGLSISFIYLGLTTRVCKCDHCGKEETRWRKLNGNWVCMSCDYPM